MKCFQTLSDHMGLPWWLSSKESACNAGDVGSIPESGRSPEEGNGNPLQHSCRENPMDRGAWWVTAHRVAKSQICLSTHTHTHTHLYTTADDFLMNRMCGVRKRETSRMTSYLF